MMPLFAVTSAIQKSRFWLTRAALAGAMLIPALTQAQADPRIDHDTTTTRAQQVAALQKGPDGVVQQAGLASWHGKHWRGRNTASGMIFDDRQLTAPSLFLPLPPPARVTNLQHRHPVNGLRNGR